MISVTFQLLFIIHIFRPSEQGCTLYKEESKLNCDLIKEILNEHNECREVIAAGKSKLDPGKDIWVLKWDDELAKVAQAYANKCLFTHNKGRPKGTGENLAWKRNSKKKRGDLKYMTHLWYEEINLYDPAGPLNITETGHFTQMIWADTKFVGCGVSFYEDGKHPNSPYQTLLVCNYKPPGNYPTPPYEKYDGTRCSRGVQSTVFPHLCAHDQEHADGKYVPCSGIKLQSTSILLFFFLLCRYYHHNLYL